MNASAKTSALLAAVASVLLLACGGTVEPLLADPIEGDGGGGGGADASAPDDSAPGKAPDAAGGDAGPGAPGDAGPVGCTAPVIRDGGKYLGCSAAVCPSGTVCVQTETEVTSTARCVAIPPACASSPTCACMGTAAQECAEPGVPLIDAGGFFGCHDSEEADASFLDFPCGCA
jgi:hypothetical protein